MTSKIDYEELEILVKAYQDGSNDAGEELVERFDGFIMKFTSVLSGGKFDINDKTQRNFIKLFIQDDEARGNVGLFKKSDYIRRVVYVTVSNLQQQLTHLDEDDIKQELTIIFLQLAGVHDHSAPLNKFLKKVFKFRVHDLVVKRLVFSQDECFSQYESLISYYDEMPECPDYDEIDHDAMDGVRYLIHSQNSTDFDENWVNGYTCGDMFQDLTTHERRLIKWYYEWRSLPKKSMDKEVYQMYKDRFKRTEQDIADLLGCSRKTVNLKRNEIKSRLEALAVELNLIHRSDGE